MEPRAGLLCKPSGSENGSNCTRLSAWDAKQTARSDICFGESQEVSVEVRKSGVQRAGLRFGAPLKVKLSRLRILLMTLLQVALRRLLRGPRHASWDFRYEWAATLMRNLSHSLRPLSVLEMRQHALPSPIPSFLRESLRHELGSFSGLYAETFTP